jgi:hypothetical protein
MLASLIVAVGLPLVAVVTNTLVRWSFGLPQSAAADLIVVLMVFDISILSVPGEILAGTPHEIRVWYGIVMMLCIALWVISLYKVERPLREEMTDDGVLSTIPLVLLSLLLG